ncbi:MAG: hypothetical protein AAF773_08990 [Cyanobacteria bacterium P01_D01_bin.115]
MNAVNGKRHGIADTIVLLRDASVPVQEQAYGFSISHPDLTDEDRPFGCCGCEHDWSISLSMFTNESPPVVWFVRFDFCEMARFLADAYAKCSANPTREEILKSMRTLDADYDRDGLESRIKEWCRAMSQQTGLDYKVP